jgi:hypothetical protein
MALAATKGGSVTLGFAIAAQRCGERTGLVDERGSLFWRQLDDAANALAHAFRAFRHRRRPSGFCAATTVASSRH